MNRSQLLAAERRRILLPRHGALRVGIGYPNTYHVALSSLAYQWVVEITARQPGVAVERFMTDPACPGTTLDRGVPLGELDVLGWSCSFEPDAVNVLRALDAAGIPRPRRARSARFPLLVLGGAVASINPLPLAPALDVFVLGAGELLWPSMLRLARELDRESLLAELARRDGYFVPAHHLDGRPAPRRCRRIEKRDVHMSDPLLLPASHVVTPNTSYADRALVEMSRGCPAKCRYCWVSHNDGRLRTYPAEAILARVREARSLTHRMGFVATAVGDHPDLPEILGETRELGCSIALSSLRIPAMRRSVLAPLADSGARSVTIAPETGSEELRRRLGKPISDHQVLEAVAAAQACGIPDLKMYFILGLPGETDADVEAIAGLLRASVDVIRGHGRERGRVGKVTAGVSFLVPKPYTPYRREPMMERREARRRVDLLFRATRSISNLSIRRPSYREALWQGYLSRADASAFAALEAVADGRTLAAVLAERAADIAAVTRGRPGGLSLPAFISSADVCRCISP